MNRLTRHRHVILAAALALLSLRALTPDGYMPAAADSAGTDTGSGRPRFREIIRQEFNRCKDLGAAQGFRDAKAWMRSLPADRGAALMDRTEGEAHRASQIEASHRAGASSRIAPS